MTEEQKDNTTGNPADSIIPLVFTTEYVDDTATNIPEPIPSNGKTENINKEAIQVIVNVPKEENKTAIIANRIAIIGTFINLALAGLTYLLFIKTGEANKTSMQSLEQAQKAVEQAKRANDIADSNFRLSVIAAKSNDEISDANFKLSTQSLNAQIKSFQETQKQFEIENKPNLQIGGINIDSISRLKISFNIRNFGKQPAKIFSISSALVYTNNPNLTNAKYEVAKSFNSFVPQDGYVPFSISAGEKILNEQQIILLKNGNYFVYIIGECKYLNTVNLQKRSYKFNYRISYNPDIDVKIIRDTDQLTK